MKNYISFIQNHILIGKKLLETEKAFIAAPMAGGITTPAFVASVTQAGGIGSLATGYLSPEQVRKSIQTIRTLTNDPFSANVFIPQNTHYNPILVEQMQKILAPYYQQLNLPMPNPATYKKVDQDFDEIVDILCQEKIPIVSFTFGCLSPELIQFC